MGDEANIDWEPPIPIGYSDQNRAFLQAFMARGTLTFGEGQQIVAAILTAATEATVDAAAVTQDDFAEFVRKAREAVAPLDFDIRSTRRQDPAAARQRGGGGERVWAFVNAHSDPATQLGTTRTPDEMAYIKRLLDAMFDTYNTPRMEVMAVDEAQALRVSRPTRPAGRESLGGRAGGEDDDAGGSRDVGVSAAAKGLKHSEVLSLLKSMVEEGWLEKSRTGFYSLAPRALMELQSWLIDTYNDPDAEDEWQRIKTCEACKEVLTVGQRCANRDCKVRLHDICQDGFWRTRRDKKCPKCHAAWDGLHFVGERAVTSTQAYQRSKPRRSGPRESELANAQEEEEEEEEEEGADDADE